MTSFRNMRRKRQEMHSERCAEILRNATSGTLALLGDGGYPYALPISYVHHDDKLYFHSATEGHKIDAIRQCDKASFCVIAQDDVKPELYTTFFRSVIAFGKIHIIEDETERMDAIRLLGRRYNKNDEAGCKRKS